MEWPERNQTNPRHERERSRVTLQLTAAEKLAIGWLSRMPPGFRDALPKFFRQFANLAERTIARELSGDRIRELARLHANSKTPPS